MAIATKDNPSLMGVLQLQQLPAMQVCRAVYQGTLHLRQTPEYLPQWEMEEDDNWKTRLAQAVLFNAFRKTCKSLTGIVTQNLVEVDEDVPADIQEHLLNIDLAGQHLNLLVQQQFLDKMVDGHVHLLVDWHGPEGARRSLDERNTLARPYWTLVRKGQVLRAWPRQHGGATVLAQFAYLESDLLRDGAFGQKEIRRVRQFDLADASGQPFGDDEELPTEEGRRVLFRSWVQVEEGGEWVPEDDVGGKLLGDRMTRIPLATDYAGRVGYQVSEPPLTDLALENLKHWQVRSDRDVNLHVTSIPVFNVFGLEAEELQTVTIGNALGIAFPGGRQEQGSEYTEAQGHGLKHSREELLDIQARMAALGLSMLERQVRVAETEKAKMLDQQAQNSELATQARATTDALNEALQLHARWMGLDPGTVGTLSLDTDFDTAAMTPELFDKYLKAVGEGVLSLDTMWDRLVAGKLLPEGFDPELEHTRIANSGMSDVAATVEALRAAQQLRALPAGPAEGEIEQEPEPPNTTEG